ncbi:MAG: adenine phosphoribosyltransferase [Elusimicrobia bacterium]|nr:adenine phosphoribosyltransferase [Elusimicrobiota bacterium]
MALSTAPATDLKRFIRDIPDFPKKGIVFKDITPLLSDGPAFLMTIALLADAGRRLRANKVVAIESRGFIFGSAVAQALGVGVIPVRKKGKLPFETISTTYALEYGTDTLEMHVDALAPGDRVLVVDDVLATGGTAEAVVRLVQKARGDAVGLAFVIELEFLSGRSKLPALDVTALIRF